LLETNGFAKSLTASDEEEELLDWANGLFTTGWDAANGLKTEALNGL
jgi:hypothetical protein